MQLAILKSADGTNDHRQIPKFKTLNKAKKQMHDANTQIQDKNQNNVSNSMFAPLDMHRMSRYRLDSAMPDD